MKKSLAYIFVIVAVLTTALAIFFFIKSQQTKTEMAEMVEQMTFEKEQLQDEYEDLAIQFDGYGRNLQNDSLADLLQTEKQRVQDLLEELRITKATNARRIAELKKELATVRAVMVQYVQQIDSLSSTNKRLTQENEHVRRQYEVANERVTTLEKTTAKLTEVVERAAMMEVNNFTITQLNERGKKINNLNKTTKLQINYTILKNITVQVGEKCVYLRICRPDGEILQKSENNVFSYENKYIPYSIRKEFEYDGENQDCVMYWTVEEILPAGIYNADFFIDGNLVGSFPFRL